MKQVLLEFAIGDTSYVLRAYSTFYTLAWLVAPIVGVWFARRRGLPWRRVLAVYALALMAGIVGARALDLFVAWRFYAEEPSRIWAAGWTGYSLYGGFVFATLVGYILARRFKVPPWQLADAAVPALVVGQLLMRTGCFLNGCCYGLPTSLPWGVRYPVGSHVWAAQLTSSSRGLLNGFAGLVDPVHPTQLYEMAGAVLFGMLALWLMHRHAADGVPALAYAIGFTLVRLGNGFLRVKQNVVTAPTWFYPVLYLSLAAILAAMLLWRIRVGRSRQL
jgi:phosphatidylglycerol:prolipoprotein diacylglycerol transferase